MCFFWMALSMPSTSACDSFLVDPLMSEKGSTSKTSKNSRPGRMANLLCPGGIHKNGMMYMNVYDIRDQPFDGKTTMARLQIMLNLMTGYGIWPLGEGCSKHGTIYMFFLCHQVTRPSHFVNSPLDHRLWWSHMKSLETLSTFDQQSLPKSHLLFQLDLPQFFSAFHHCSPPPTVPTAETWGRNPYIRWWSSPVIGSVSASSPASSPGKIGLPGTPLGDLALILSIQGQCPVQEKPIGGWLIMVSANKKTSSIAPHEHRISGWTSPRTKRVPLAWHQTPEPHSWTQTSAAVFKFCLKIGFWPQDVGFCFPKKKHHTLECHSNWF